jgi:RNA polymerase sigma-70 factor (ECF subfamily)
MEKGESVFRSKLVDEAGPVRSWLMRYFRRRVQNAAEIEDMVQDVFTRMVARDSTEPVEHLGGYVLKTASSVLTDWIRRRTSHAASQHVAFEPELHGEEEVDPERILGGKEELQVATKVLLQLPERTRTVFVLRRIEGWKFQQIAAHLGISVSAVEKHMVRAVEQLGIEMEKRRGS